MGGILFQNVEQELIQALRKDNSKKLKELILNKGLNPDTLYTKRKRTLVQLSCYFLSPKCLSILIELNYDYNKKETINNYTPLYIACKFNCLPIVKILLEKDDCKILQKTTDNFNELEIAFLKGNYDICHYLLYEYKQSEEKPKDDETNINNEKDDDNDDEINTKQINLKENKKQKKIISEIKLQNIDQPYQKYFLSKDFDLDHFISLQEQNQCPLFNMPLFYQSLLERVPPTKCPSFAPERKRTKEMMTKIPDPNETWGHFFKRMVNFELYNPPLVDKRNVSHMNSMYMNAQMKLMESEYGVKMSYYEDENNNNRDNIDNSNQEINQEEPIIKITKKNKGNKKREETEESEEKNIIQINVENTIKKSLNNKKNEEDDNTNVRDKEDFYSLDVHNSSGRKVNENDN